MGKFKRKIIQVLSALLYNANLAGFADGKLYRGAVKGVCVPGLNCYSCPGAIGACPLGSLQNAMNDVKTSFPFYIVGTLLLFGALFGRLICAFLCPIGLIQELLYYIPTKKIRRSRATRMLSNLKYVVLAVFVVGLPLYYLFTSGVSVPAFCKYICPSGTLFAGIPLVASDSALFAIIGPLFDWKVLVLITVLIMSVFIYRPFCRFLCPLGLIYSFFNKIAVFGIKVDRDKCTDCGACTAACKMDTKKINDRECIRCGECRSVCPHGAIYSTCKKSGEKLPQKQQ